MTTPDFTYIDHGSIILLSSATDEGKTWASQNLPENTARHGSAYAIERRYFADIIDGIDADGLTFHPGA